MTYYVGVDLGTSGLKILLGVDGQLIGSTSCPISLSSPKENYSEQDPIEWLTAFDSALLDLIKKFPEIQNEDLIFGFSGQMHSLVLLDQKGNVLRPAILWNDGRTTEEVQFLKKYYGKHLIKVEKNHPLEGFTLPKILWVQRNEAAIWGKTWKFLLPKDYLLYYLTGKVRTESSDAAGTLLYDPVKRGWDTELLTKLNIAKEQCPTIHPSTEIIDEMKSELKEKFRLSGNVQLVMGGADNACGALAAISDPESQGLLSVGTSGVVLIYEKDNESIASGNYHYFASLTGQNYKMGVTLSAGYSLNWIKKMIAPELSFSRFTLAAETSEIGSRGITFLPYLFGERSPYYDPSLSGSFLGLKAYHDRGDMIRSVMEGIAFSLKNTLESMKIEQNQLVDTFRVTGGVVKNEFWLQLFADILNVKIEVLASDEGPAYGALLCGVIASQAGQEWQSANPIKKSYFPNLQHSRTYQQFFAKFKRLSEKSRSL